MDVPNFSAYKIGVGPIQFLKEAQAELKKVKWPTKKEVTRLTGIVLLVSTGVGIFLSGLDLLFTNIFSIIIK